MRRAADAESQQPACAESCACWRHCLHGASLHTLWLFSKRVVASRRKQGASLSCCLCWVGLQVAKHTTPAYGIKADLKRLLLSPETFGTKWAGSLVSQPRRALAAAVHKAECSVPRFHGICFRRLCMGSRRCCWAAACRVARSTARAPRPLWLRLWFLHFPHYRCHVPHPCRFDVVLIDPPWEEYVRRAPGFVKEQEREAWKWQEIMELDIKSIADNPSFVFL